MIHVDNCSPDLPVKRRVFYNPFEISFCGFSGSGKTTLIEKLVLQFTKEVSVAYVKHDAHGFQMDQAGKDTSRISSAGASAVFINHENESALLQHIQMSEYQRVSLFREFDWVFVEGFKKNEMPKIVLIDKEGAILKEYENGLLKNVIAFVGEKSVNINDVPFFYRNDVDSLKSFIASFFWQDVKKLPIYGLILTGGKSSRMGQDKAMLEYHGQTQINFLSKTMQDFCNEVFVSVRQHREGLHLPQLEDTFVDIGPMGGILTAMKSKPQAAWLVVACDLPLLNHATLQYLFEKRNPFRNATVYQSSEDGFPEPLCALYEPKAKQALFHFLSLGYQCPRKVLINSSVELLPLPDITWLKNANTPEEYQMIVEEIKRGVR